MTIIFLAPPFRRPYELYYFCSFPDNITIVIDKETFNKYSDWFREFETLGYQYAFASLEVQRAKRLFNFASTGALINYDENDLSKIIQNKKISKIITVELFSSLSAQAARIALKHALQHIVIVWENIPKHPFYRIPPFSTNTDFVKSSAKRIITVSEISKRSVISLGVEENRIDTIYPGIFVNKFRQSDDSTDRILFIGNLDPHKGVNLLLHAFKQLSKHFDIRLTLVGNGSLESDVTKLKNTGLNIEHQGYVSHSNISTLYSNASIFCSPSVTVRKFGFVVRQEQFGFTLVEAMASGLPIVSTNVGAIPEIIGDNLIVLPTIKGIFEGLHKLLSSDDLRKQLRHRNRVRSTLQFNALTQSKLFEKTISNNI